MNPYWTDGLISIYHGDCVEVLPEICKYANPVLAISDPPYGQTSLAWDKWDGRWLNAIPRSVGALWCFGSLRMFMQHAPDFDVAEWKLSQDLVWEKHNGSSFHVDRFRRVHEQVCHFYRGAWKDHQHRPPVTMDATKRTVRRKNRPAHMGEVETGNYKSQDGGPRLMRSVIYQRSMHGAASHPTEKPVGLIKALIDYATVDGDCIAVPFAGVGSELVAAKEMNRRAVGVEISEQYCEVAAKRLSQGIINYSVDLRNSPEYHPR